MTTNRGQHQDPSPDPAGTNTHRIVADMALPDALRADERQAA